jgi:hypothetical protein
MSGKPPKKRKTAAGSLRLIAKRLGLPYDHTKPKSEHVGFCVGTGGMK